VWGGGSGESERDRIASASSFTLVGSGGLSSVTTGHSGDGLSNVEGGGNRASVLSGSMLERDAFPTVASGSGGLARGVEQGGTHAFSSSTSGLGGLARGVGQGGATVTFGQAEHSSMHPRDSSQPARAGGEDRRSVLHQREPHQSSMTDGLDPLGRSRYGSRSSMAGDVGGLESIQQRNGYERGGSNFGGSDRNPTSFDLTANRRAFGAANNVDPSTSSSLGSATTLSGSANTTPSKSSASLGRLPSLFGATGLGSDKAGVPAPFMSAPAGASSVFKGFGKFLASSASPSVAPARTLELPDDVINGKNNEGEGEMSWTKRSDNKVKDINNNKTRLCLVELLRDDGYCRGVIGTSGRLCISSRDNCSKASHRTANPYLAELYNQGVEQALFVQAPSSKSSPTTAYEAPYINATLFSDDQI
jgi:hypothetical protein